MAIEDALTERVLAMSPETIPGVVAKLQFLVQYGAPGPETEEFPWAELEALLQSGLYSTDVVVRAAVRFDGRGLARLPRHSRRG